MASPFFVYVLENELGRFYVGQTDDLTQRLAEHNTPDPTGRRFTAKNGNWTLLWSEQHPDRSSAIRRERQIKAMRSSRWIREHLLKASNVGRASPGAPGLTAKS